MNPTILRQSTAVNVVVGPVVSSSDFVTAMTALTIAQADRQLNKNWAASFAQTADTANATHVARGFYRFQLTTGDTDTLGPLILSINMGSSAPFWKEFRVVTAYEFDIQQGNNRRGAAHYGTAQGGAALSIQLAASAPSNDADIRYCIVHIVGGTGAGQWRYGVSYTGSSRTLAVDRAWATNPDSTSQYVIYPAMPLSTLAEVADAFHDEVVDGSLTFRQSTRLANAVLGGKASGLAGTTATYRDPADTKNRVVATVDASGNRTAVTRDLT